ncbi:efflux RND transporter permease subunit [soil metagenome]
MASISDVSIKRPVLATVMSLTIIVFGLIGLSQLGVREYPIMEPPVVSVQTSLRGANAEVIEAQVTEPLEESINSIDGIRSLTSASREGRSSITIEFNLGMDIDAAAAEVRDRVSRARGRLPQEVEEPVVSRSNADAQPIAFLGISSDRHDLLDLSRIADTYYRQRLQTIEGVSGVDIWGEKRYSMRLIMDPLRLAAYNLTPLDVRQAVQRQNVELPGGRIEGDQVELTVRPMTRLSTIDDFQNLLLKADGTTLVRFGDVGRVELAALNQRTLLKRDGVEMVGVVLRPLPGANYIAIADEFHERIAEIERDLPAGVSAEIGFDVTEQIRASIYEVRNTVFIALMLVILVIFLFLRDWRTTLIPVLVIPVSLIGAFGMMALFGFTINVLTLLAIVLAIGLVVDDAVVVLENIYAKVEAGAKPIQAALTGTREIYLAVIATTLSLVAVFLPIIMQTGIVGSLFREFGITLAGAVVISSFVALTLTPMLSSKLLKRRDVQPWFYRKTEPAFVRLNERYRTALATFMQRRWMAFVVMGFAGALIVIFFISLETELAPQEDRSQLTLSANAQQGRGFEYMEAYMNRLADLVEQEVPEAHAIVSITSPGFGGGSVSSGFVRVTLVPPEERARTQTEIANALQAAVRQLPGARVFVQQPATISTAQTRGLPVQLVLQANTLQQLNDVLPTFLERAGQDPAFQFVRANLEFTQPELQVAVDRDRARSLGVDATDVAQTMQVALSEGRLGYFLMDGMQYEVIGQVERISRSDPSGLRGLFVRSASGESVLLDNVVSVREGAAPPQLFRYDRFAAVTISASPAPGVPLGRAIETMEAVAAEVLPEGVTYTWTGQSRDFRDTSGQIYVAFLLALLLIYLVLAAQFESFRDPAVILLTVPLALVGALAFLWYFQMTLNVFSQIGLVMLIGLVTKNGILIVEFAKQRRAQGADPFEAVINAAAVRFRPILMTALSTILGILPIALALGAGAESRMPMGIAVIGGLLIGTFLTLFVIPALYTYIASREMPAAFIEEVVHIPGTKPASPAAADPMIGHRSVTVRTFTSDQPGGDGHPAEASPGNGAAGIPSPLGEVQPKDEIKDAPNE